MAHSKYYSVNDMKREMGRTCGTYGEIESA